MKEIIVIGGGASGLVAAITAAKSNNKVTIIEKNTNCGKKILMTGNGKCNYWNEDISINHYYSSNKEILTNILTNENKKSVMDFFESIGIIPKIKDGYYYPASNQATSIQTALILEAKLSEVNMINNEEVLSIKKQGKKFIINTTIKEWTCDKVILATGSKAIPKTGSDGLGYKIASSFGHTIIKPLPALVQLIGQESYFKDWQGIRSDVEVSLFEDKKLIKTSKGEIQLTNYGLSGICIFQLSSLVSRGIYQKKEEQIQINFLYPFSIHTEEEFILWMDKRNHLVKGRTISDLLDGLLNYKLINLILKLSKIKREITWNQLTLKEKQLLGRNLTKLTVNIKETNSFESAQVCTGGIPLSEINPNTMESLKQKSLYIVGELLDVDGECGGFNLGFAWITGLLAGSSMKETITK